MINREKMLIRKLGPNRLIFPRDDIYTGSCGMLNGSAGEFFPPYREQTHVDFFTPDLCRFKNSFSVHFS